MKQLKQQLNLFYIALGFLTRLPVPQDLDFSQEHLNQANRYFSLVGWLIGGICALFLWSLMFFLPTTLSIIFSMLLSVLLTGCFHEDGLADTCDGFGGGWTQEQKLTIMKDSRLGTYAATGLWFALSIKFFLLWHISLLSDELLFIALIVSHPISRAVSSVLVFVLPYVAGQDASKVKPLAEGKDFFDLKINLLIAGLALFLITDIALVLLLVLLALVVIARLFLLKHIQGFTGDTLGATQQVAELSIYLVLLILGAQA